jgi:hypothetical protein
MPNVAFKCKEYAELLPRWTLIRDCVSGEEAVKAKKDTYLPRPNPEDTTPANEKRYEQYVVRAVFYNVTGRTHRELTGQVFAKDAVTEVPEPMLPFVANVDGGGMKLDQHARIALGNVLAYGRAGLLVDYPEVSGPVTIADIESGRISPSFVLFGPWDIINWRVKYVEGRVLTSLIVLNSCEMITDDGFETKTGQFFRVLRLTDDGIYSSEEWVFDNALNDYQMRKQTFPRDADGQPWVEIPFSFIGCENNEASPNLPPLYDMAALNIAHYRNSADYEESSYICGQPTPVFTGLTKEWVKDVLKGEIRLGARGAVLLPENAEGNLLQAEPNTMPKEAMDQKEKQMVAIGARLVEEKGGNKSATEAAGDQAQAGSVLSSSANNVSQAYSKALQWAAQFMGQLPAKREEVYYELNTEFHLGVMTPQEQAQLIALWQAQAISETEMRNALKRSGIAYLDDKDWKAEIEATGPDLGTPVKKAESEAQAAALAAKQKQTPPAK